MLIKPIDADQSSETSRATLQTGVSVAAQFEGTARALTSSDRDELARFDRFASWN
jgi:hypothetical protein